MEDKCAWCCLFFTTKDFLVRLFQEHRLKLDYSESMFTGLRKRRVSVSIVQFRPSSIFDPSFPSPFGRLFLTTFLPHKNPTPAFRGRLHPEYSTSFCCSHLLKELFYLGCMCFLTRKTGAGFATEKE